LQADPAQKKENGVIFFKDTQLSCMFKKKMVYGLSKVGFEI